MAVSTVETIVANPARKRTRMARRMTLKQKLHFGTAKVRAAAKAALKATRSRKRNAAKRRHRPSFHRRHRRRKSNPGEIIAMTLGNPARRKKGRKRMAATKRRRRRHASNPAGHHRRRRHTVHHRRRRRPNPGHRRRTAVSRGHRRRSRRVYNPAGYRWSDIFVLGGGAAVGSSLSSAGTQLILGSSNTGPMGYAGNLISTFVLSWLGGMVTRNRMFPAGILAGGIGALIRRVIADYSLFGGYTASLGMGDYLVSNWVAPQRLMDDFRSLTSSNFGPFNAGAYGGAQGTWGPQGGGLMSSSGVSTRGMGLEGDPSMGGSAGY